MNFKKTKKGFTLVELLISAAVFAMFLTAFITVLVDVTRSSRRITLEYQIYQDLRIMAKQISDLLENNTIDYEEYYRQAVGASLYTRSSATDANQYVYGDYQKIFYNFGSDDAPGALCNDGTPADAACVLDKTSIDKYLGKNPPLAIDGPPESASAFCGGNIAAPCPVSNRQAQLFLINEKGNKKTVLALEPITKNVLGNSYDEKALSIAWFNGTDTNSDDIADIWKIGDEFLQISDDPLGDTENANLMADLSVTKNEEFIYDNFSPISPLRTNILDVQFYVSPLEDPYKAFAETDPAIGTLMQPHITIIITVEPSASELTNYIGKIPRQTIQTTIYSKVNKEVKSF